MSRIPGFLASFTDRNVRLRAFSFRALRAILGTFTDRLRFENFEKLFSRTSADFGTRISGTIKSRNSRFLENFRDRSIEILGTRTDILCPFTARISRTSGPFTDLNFENFGRFLGPKF